MTNQTNQMMTIARKPVDTILLPYLSDEQIGNILESMKVAHEKALELFGNTYASLENLGFEVVAQGLAESITKQQDMQIEMYLAAKKTYEDELNRRAQ